MAVSITTSLHVGLVAGTGVTFSAPVVPDISTDDIYNPDNPNQTLTNMLSGISSEKLLGSVTIDGTETGLTSIYTVPAGKVVIPSRITFALTDISGTGNPPSVNVGWTADNYDDLIDSTITSIYDLESATVFAAGNDYVPTDTLTLSGGTFDTVAEATVATTKLVSLDRDAAGIEYTPADTITLAGGTASTKAIVTVLTCKLVSATVNAGGTFYGNAQTFDVSVAGGTRTVVATVNVTTDSGGIVTTINSISLAGSYTVLPTLTANAVSGDNGTDHGTGLTLDLVFGVNSFEISTPGSYTANASNFTQFATDGSGSGATFNSTSFGVDTVTVSDAGSYTVLPSNHVSTVGGGSGCTLDPTWDVLETLFDEMDTINRVLSLPDLGKNSTTYGTIDAANVIKANVVAAATYDDYELTLYFFGFQVAE